MTGASLTVGERELVALAASVAAGCRPCTEYHVARARAASVDDNDLREAVAAALRVREDSRAEMVELAQRLIGGSDGGTVARSAGTSLDELMCLAASFAVNSSQGLERHLENAMAAGATRREIAVAVSIARAVRTTAGEKLEALVTGFSADASAASVCRPDAVKTCVADGGPQAESHACAYGSET
jgi:AhpD family alkylhydroperoxidase